MSCRRRVIAAFAALVVMSSCSSGGESPGAAVTTVPSGTTEVTDAVATVTTIAAAEPTTAPTTAAPATAPSEPAVPSTVVSDPAPTVPAVVVSDPPQTGVPGVDADAVCRSVGTLLVTEYLVGLVEAFGTGTEARRVEAVAAPAVLQALGDLEAAVGPAGLASDPVAARWAGLRARATTATAAADLAGAGLLTRWLELLATHDRNDPAIDLALDPTQSGAVDRAAAAIGERHGPIATDPDQLAAVLVATPAIDAHAADRCPEVAVFGTGDAV